MSKLISPNRQNSPSLDRCTILRNELKFWLLIDRKETIKETWKAIINGWLRIFYLHYALKKAQLQKRDHKIIFCNSITEIVLFYHLRMYSLFIAVTKKELEATERFNQNPYSLRSKNTYDGEFRRFGSINLLMFNYRTTFISLTL